MSRLERHGTVRRLIAEQPIGTQNDLAAALRSAGHDVVQTTVSRDVAELGLVKVRAENGRLIYAEPGTATANGNRMHELRQALRSWAMSLEASGNIVIVTTPAGFADPLAQAIDDSGHPEIIGTIAGENTVLVVAREGVAGATLREDLRSGLALSTTSPEEAH